MRREQGRVALLLLAVFTLAATLATAELNTCVWAFRVTEGKQSTEELEPRWKHNACSGRITYSVSNAHGNSAHFVGSQAVLLMTPPLTDLGYGKFRQTTVDVNVLCNGVTPLCSAATVYYVVESAQAPPTTDTPITTEPPIVDPICKDPPTVTLTPGTTDSFYVMKSVQGCTAATIALTGETNTAGVTGPFFAPTMINGQPVLQFGKPTPATAEGTYTATIHVSCGGIPSTGSCTIHQSVIVFSEEPSSSSSSSSSGSSESTTVPPEPTPACTGTYQYIAYFDTELKDTVVVDAVDAALCPHSSPVFLFATVEPPHYNPGSFSLSKSTGAFIYVAPAGPTVKRDTFGFSVGCQKSGSEMGPVTPVCNGVGAVLITAAPNPPSPNATCPGDFQFVFARNKDGSLTAPLSNLMARATVTQNGFCDSGKYVRAFITRNPNQGTLEMFNAATGTFVYTRAFGPVQNISEEPDYSEEFNFQLQCASGDACTANAIITVTPPLDPDAVYHLNSNTIVCRGSCDARSWKSSPRFPGAEYFDSTDSPLGAKYGRSATRKDGRGVDEVEFGFTEKGELLIYAYTSIGNMGVRFVTFEPIDAAKVLSSGFDSDSLPPDSHTSFDVMCLDRQEAYGTAANLWSWTDEDTLQGHVNEATENYRLGESFYHKFGGKHRNCDVYRADPCKYAPLMTPTVTSMSSARSGEGAISADESRPAVQWRLFVNDCDATWVGRASVQALRAMHFANGSLTFALSRDGTHLSGIVYSQAVKPASWTTPEEGIVMIQRAYKLEVAIRNTIIVDAIVELIGETVVSSAPTSSGTASAAAAADATDDEGELFIASDVQFASAQDRRTNERLYAYAVLLYPYHITKDGTVSISNTSSVTVVSINIVNATWTSPSPLECAECTGTRSTCFGTGTGFETDCGADALISFEAIDPNLIVFDQDPHSVGGNNLFPATKFPHAPNYNISFLGRVKGVDSTNSTDIAPVGVFYFSIHLSNHENVIVMVNQSDYVSEINPQFSQTRVCRSSAYWPVADSLGISLPVQPFDASTLAHGDIDSPEEKTFYGAPERLTPSDKCIDPISPTSHSVTIDSLTKTFSVGEASVTASMCSLEDARTYGVTDWVLFAIPRGTLANNSKTDDASSWSSSTNQYTVPEMQYVVLTVDVSEVVSTATMGTDPALFRARYINILLDGTKPPTWSTDDETIWMLPDGGASSEDQSKIIYYNWESFASFVNYRRIYVKRSDDSAAAAMREPFSFAFTPGTLLHSASSGRVPMNLHAGIKYTTYEEQPNAGTVKVSDVEEKVLFVITISRTMSAEIRFDSDAYTPKLITVRTNGLGKTTATSLLIVFLVAIVIVLGLSVFVEVKFKRIIHNAKYHPKHPDSAVGVRYDRHGRPIAGAPTVEAAEAEDDDASGRSGTTRVKIGGQKTDKMITKFGAVGVEQQRIADSEGEDYTEREKSRKQRVDREGHAEKLPDMGTEQQRLMDDDADETADFSE